MKNINRHITAGAIIIEYERLKNYLTIEALEDGLTAKLSNNACQYSTDGVTWTNLAAGTTTPAINKGKKLYFKATGLTPTSSAGIGTFTVNKQFNLSGNCMSMLFGDEAEYNLDLTGKSYAFYRLFYNCTKLKSVSSGFLPATTLTTYCYQYMFYGCTGLTNSPELPATTLASYCYYYMFYGCTGLTNSPELPATTLANYCYTRMFSGTNILPDCTNIDFSSPAVLQSGGLIGLFGGTKVTDSDLRSILPINPDTGNYRLPATTLASYCYQQMFVGCSKLTTAPELPATSLSTECYKWMFQDCTSLTTAPELPATSLSTGCYRYMFQGCTSLTTAPALPATRLITNCYEYMFKGCTSLTTAPELPAKTLASYCYTWMFYGCSSLNYIKALFTTTPDSSYTSNWVSGVASTGTFVKNINATWDVTGVNGVPSGWTVQINITPIRCISLSITADDVYGRSTNTKIYWTAEVEGVDDNGNTLIVTRNGTDISESFPQNTSTTDTVERTISYTYMGVTATTTITQGVWVDVGYTVNLNDQWQSSSIANPDSSLYDGVYESFSNKGVGNTAAIMYIDIEGYNDFDLYIRSYAESINDYVMVSQLDQTINNSTSYSNTTLVKAHTRGNQKSGTSIDNYTKVSFTGIDGGQHRITIVYRKDGSVNSGADRGYVLIPKNQ